MKPAPGPRGPNPGTPAERDDPKLGLAALLRLKREVPCWCGAEILQVPTRVLDKGSTWSCGAPTCKGPK